MELTGRHIVVTGAASGIGLACATRFEEEGARVTRADLNASGDIVQVDVGRRDEIDALIATAEERNGEIDIFFSNAGITGAVRRPARPHGRRLGPAPPRQRHEPHLGGPRR